MSIYVTNHVMMFDDVSESWNVYPKMKGIPLSCEAYGKSNIIGTGSTVDDAIESAVKNNVKRWDIEIEKPENS